MGTLTPDGYRRLAMPDLVAMTWDRIESHEREHYGLLLVRIENGGLSADEQVRLDDLERRREVQLSRLMPVDAHDEVPGERTDGDQSDGDQSDGDQSDGDQSDGDQSDGDQSDGEETPTP